MADQGPKKNWFSFPTPDPKNKPPAKPPSPAPQAPRDHSDETLELPKKPGPAAHSSDAPTILQNVKPVKKRTFVFTDATPPPLRQGAPAASSISLASFSTSIPTQDLSAEKILMPAARSKFNEIVAPMLGGIPLVCKLGQGGMGAVYLGVDPETQQEVAVKVLPFHLAERDPVMIDRFFREAELAAKIVSPHLVRVSGAREENGLCFLVMEFVSGDSAGGYAKKKGKGSLDEPEALDICIAATQGLCAAHAAGVIHRDLKPDNILIPKDPQSGQLKLAEGKLADLGLARMEEHGQSLTASQTGMGTPGYMSPEQATDARKCGKPADIFSLGATLYSLLAGRSPFHAKAPIESIMKTLNDPHEPLTALRPDVSPAVAALVDRCLAKDPRYRFKDADALLRGLRLCRSVLGRGAEEQTRAVEAMRRPAGETAVAKKDDAPYFDALTIQSDAKPRRPEVEDLALENALRAQAAPRGIWTKMVAMLILAGFLGAGVAMFLMAPPKPEHAEAKAGAPAAPATPEPAPAPAPTPAPATQKSASTGPAGTGDKRFQDIQQQRLEQLESLAHSMEKVKAKVDQAKIVEPILPISSAGELSQEEGHFTTARVMFAFFASVVGLAYMLYSRKSRGLVFGLCGAVLLLASWLLPSLPLAVMLCGVCLAVPLFMLKTA